MNLEDRLSLLNGTKDKIKRFYVCEDLLDVIALNYLGLTTGHNVNPNDVRKCYISLIPRTKKWCDKAKCDFSQYNKSIQIITFKSKEEPIVIVLKKIMKDKFLEIFHNKKNRR
jgi:hypothetical protein